MMSGTVADTEKKPARGTKTVVKCPIDSEEFESTEQLSQHVDQVHIGPGLLSAFKGECWAKDLRERKK